MKLMRTCLLGWLCSVPSIVAAQASDNPDIAKALELLSLSVRCPSENQSASYVEYRSTGSDVLLLLEESAAAASDSGSSQDVVHYAANIVLLDGAVAREDELVISCADGKSCISKAEFYIPGCVDGLCGNGSRAAETTISSQTTLELKLCQGQVDRAAVALNLLIDEIRSAGSSRWEGTFELVGVPPPYALAVRSESNANFSAIGAIAADSGPLKLYGCNDISGQKHRWCQIDWGGKAGWVSMKRLQPISSPGGVYPKDVR